MKRIAGVILILVLIAAAFIYFIEQSTCYIPRPKSMPRIIWTYEAPQRGGFVATPWVEGDTIFASAVLTQGLRLTGGGVCDRSGERRAEMGLHRGWFDATVGVGAGAVGGSGLCRRGDARQLRVQPVLLERHDRRATLEVSNWRPHRINTDGRERCRFLRRRE